MGAINTKKRNKAQVNRPAKPLLVLKKLRRTGVVLFLKKEIGVHCGSRLFSRPFFLIKKSNSQKWFGIQLREDHL